MWNCQERSHHRPQQTYEEVRGDLESHVWEQCWASQQTQEVSGSSGRGEGSSQGPSRLSHTKLYILCGDHGWGWLSILMYFCDSSLRAYQKAYWTTASELTNFPPNGTCCSWLHLSSLAPFLTTGMWEQVAPCSPAPRWLSDLMTRSLLESENHLGVVSSCRSCSVLTPGMLF